MRFHSCCPDGLLRQPLAVGGSAALPVGTTRLMVHLQCRQVNV